MLFSTLVYLLVVCRLAAGSCPHTYTSQPPQDLVCNPYINRMIQIECGVIGSNLTRIEWYFSTSNNKDGNVLETNNSKYTFHKISSEENLTVVLTINDLNEKNDTGYYWCRAFLLDGTMLSSTTSFELKTMDRYGELACRIDVIVKNSFSVCAIPTNLVFTITPSSPTRKATQSPASVMTNEILKTVVFSASDPTSTISPSGTHQVRVFYIIIGLVGFLILLCALLAFIVCLLCKKVRKNRQKESEYAKEFCNTNQSDVFKRPDLPAFSMETTVQSENSKNSNGDYAEIGPELMSSVRFHSLGNPHYSEIILQPIPLSESGPHDTGPRDFGGKENPYDEPSDKYISEGNTFPNSLSENLNCSRLEGSIVPPKIYCTTSESDYTSEQNDGTCNTILPLPHLPTILEHPYQILEQPSDPDCQGSEVYVDQPTSYESEYDRLVDPQFYKVLDQSATLSKIYDINSGPYSKLQSSKSQSMSEKLEIFDDMQYVATPASIPKSADGIVNNTNTSSLDTRMGNKYYGDYERDPIYMQKFKVDDSSSLNFYQPLQVTALDPLPDYEHYLKPIYPASLDTEN